MVLAMVILGVALPISPAGADPILVMGGSIIIEGPIHASATVFGTQGFKAQVGLGAPALCMPCGAPGDSVPLSFNLDTVDGGGGTVELGGVSYRVGGILTPGVSVLALSPFAGRVILPPLAPSAAVSAPFELLSLESSFFIDYEDGSVATFPLVGRGTATLALTPNRFGAPLWEFDRLEYEFAPVPEPATLWLIGSGMLVLAARRHRRRTGPERHPN
jgi:hypothetical protein